ncbi:M56 family metallopeptidase [Tomitella biformata]|uniref:M56 family metallopeptidase n=1 Tax=Tomitella biformata TaxID=630403 RepID=UPI00046602C7|nr:M56 family metallopeptidase [Tomitella biformata]
MILAAGLLLAVVVIGYGAPRYLQVTVAPGLNPRLAMAAWLGSIGAFLAALVAVPAALFLRPGRNFLTAASACVGRIQEDRALPWLESVQVVLTLVLAAVLVHVLVVVARRLRRHRAWSAEHLRMLRLLGEPAGAHRGIEVLRLGAPDAVFYSVGGAHCGTIVASGDIGLLDHRQLQAVLDHEEAHLRGRHHLIVVVAESLAAALPFVPLCRQAPDALRTLVEFAADHRAADRWGADAVGSALLALQSASPAAGAPQSALAMSRDAVNARLCWLTTGPTRRQRLLAAADYPLAITVSLAPVLVSVLTMALGATLLCVWLGG